MKKILCLLALSAWAVTGCHTNDSDTNPNANGMNSGANGTYNNNMPDQQPAAPAGGGTKSTQ
jgi:hypothetical protein